MARFFQYQAKTEAPLRASPVTQTMPWFQAWSEPPVKTRIAPRLAIALMVSGLFAPITPQFFAGTGTAVANSIPTNIQFQQQFQYQALALPATTPAAATTSIGWFIPWSEPTRRTGLGTHLQDVGAPDVPNPPPVLSSQWFEPWSEPTRLGGLKTALQDVGAPDVVLPPPVLVSQWVYPWADPVRVKLGLAACQQQAFAWGNFTPAAVTNDTRWIYPWSEPTRRVGLNTALQDVGAPDVPNPPPVLASQWIYPWSEPVRLKQGLAVQYQQQPAWSNFTPTAAVVNLGWLQPLSFIPPPKTIVSMATFNFMAVDNALTNFWYAPWPDFTKAKTSILAGQQQALAWNTTTPAAVVFTDTRWVYPWSEPVRTLRGLPAYQQQFFAQNIFPIPPAPINDVRWLAPWAEPIRQKAGLATGLQQASVDPPEFPNLPTAAVATSAISSPVFFKGRMIYSSYVKPVFVADDITKVSNWFSPWSEPVRTRQFAAAQQQALAWSNFTPATGVVPEDRWHQPWSEPVRLKRMPTADSVAAPAQTIQPPNILVSQWFNPLSDPVRIKRGLLAALQQAQIDTVEFPTLPAGIVTSNALSSPVFWRGRFIYQSYTKPYVPIAAPIIVSQWNSPWSTPTIPKITVSEADFGFAAVRPAVDVTVVLNATETNSDVALFAAVVYNAVASCNVSIREIPAQDSAAVSIEEIPAINGAAASIEEA